MKERINKFIIHADVVHSETRLASSDQWHHRPTNRALHIYNMGGRAGGRGSGERGRGVLTSIVREGGLGVAHQCGAQLIHVCAHGVEKDLVMRHH